MAWKDHQAPPTKTCRGLCGRELPRDEQHFRFNVKKRDGKEFLYADSMCRSCRREWENDHRRLKRREAGIVEGHGADPGGDLQRAVNLVLFQHVSQREAVRQTGVSRSRLRNKLGQISGRATRDVVVSTVHGSADYVPSAPVLKELAVQARINMTIPRYLCEEAGFSSRVLDVARESGRILAADVDALFVSVGRPDLAHILTQDVLSPSSSRPDSMAASSDLGVCC